MIARIDHFLLIKYSRPAINTIFNARELSTPPTGLVLETMQKEQSFCYKQMILQLKFFYPKSTIHVLTNEKEKDSENIVFHYHENMPSTHESQLGIFNIIDKSYMYLDCDILIIKPFEDTHIKTDNEINYFGSNGIIVPYKAITGSGKEMIARQNCGMMWVKSPSSSLQSKVNLLRDKFFSNEEKNRYIKVNGTNPEIVMSTFVEYNNLKMNYFKDVNVGRTGLAEEILLAQQTIHYGGWSKKQMLLEYKKISYMARQY